MTVSDDHKRTTALVLAGHGSHISPQTAGLVWQRVDGLRALAVADEVTAAFWKEAPSFHQVLSTLAADEITIVPLFTAQGYFTRTVIPAEMGLTGSLTVLPENAGLPPRTIRYARTLSEHPYLSRIVQQRVAEGLQRSGAQPEKAAVAIIGHSTRRNPESRKATEAQADLLRRTLPLAEVLAVYLDDEPGIAEVYDLTSAPTLIAVPYFLALGSHTTIDVPTELSLPAGQTNGTVRGRRVFYTDPVGIEDSLQDVILELAYEAGLARRELRDAQAGSVWGSFPAAGRAALIRAVQEVGALIFGELYLTPDEVRPVSAGSSSYQLREVQTPAELRSIVRDDPFRPLSTAKGLPGGWRVPIREPDKLHAVVETVYPGAVADWAAHQAGHLRPETLLRTTARQTGMYRALGDLPDPAMASLVSRVCGGCVRHATWYHGHDESTLPHDKSVIPCAEPCNFWMSTALAELEAAQENR